MKLNLIYAGQSDLLNGYLNIHPFAIQPQEEPQLEIGDVKNLDRYVAQAEATEIIALDCIDYFLKPELFNILIHWISKLRQRGIITIGGTDLMKISKAFIQRDISLEDANALIYGIQSKPHLTKRVALTGYELSKFLESSGLHILHKREDKFDYMIKAQRP